MKWNQFALFLRPLDVISGCVGPSCHQKREREGAAHLIWMQEGRRGSEFLSSCPHPPSPPHTTFPPVWNEKFINFITFRYRFEKLVNIVLESCLKYCKKSLYYLTFHEVMNITNYPIVYWPTWSFNLWNIQSSGKVKSSWMQTADHCSVWTGIIFIFLSELEMLGTVHLVQGDFFLWTHFSKQCQVMRRLKGQNSRNK